MKFPQFKKTESAVFAILSEEKTICITQLDGAIKIDPNVEVPEDAEDATLAEYNQAVVNAVTLALV
jgi:hypothetical protein